MLNIMGIPEISGIFIWRDRAITATGMQQSRSNNQESKRKKQGQYGKLFAIRPAPDSNILEDVQDVKALPRETVPI